MKKLNFIGTVVDERKKQMFSVATDGKTFNIVPKFGNAWDSISRFMKVLSDNLGGIEMKNLKTINEQWECSNCNTIHPKNLDATYCCDGGAPIKIK